MSRVMRVSVMMRKAKHERALDGAASLGRLETGAHSALLSAAKCARQERSPAMSL